MRIPRRLALPLVAAGGFAYVRKIHRFRDPVRLAGAAEGEVLCPADGMVSFVRHIDQNRSEELDWPVSELFRQPTAPEGWLIGILVGPLDVHYTYFPASGSLTHAAHHEGEKHAVKPAHLLTIMVQQPVDLLDEPGTRSNERFTYTLLSEEGRIQVAAIGSAFGLQAQTYAEQDDVVRMGNKALFLPEGGLVVTFLPASFLPAVSVGDRVQGAHTVMARRKG